MNGRAKLRKALRHEEGPVPVDCGATPTTGMHVNVVAALREHFGLPRRPVQVSEPYQMLGLIEEDLRQALGIDVVGVTGPGTFFGFRQEHWKEWRTPWGQTVLVPGGFQVDERPDGVFVYPQGDRTVRPSGHMPVGGYFFDAIIRQQPIDEDNLNPADNLEEFGPLTPSDLDHFRRASEAAAATGAGVAAVPGGTSFGDIALVPGTAMLQPKGVRDVSEWYMTVAAHPEFVRELFSRQCDIALANLGKLRDVMGDRIDAVFVCGTDFGTQIGQFCSPQTFDDLWLPVYRRVNDWIHAHTPWKTFKHSCGAINPLIPRLIEAGFDILNPVQCSAAGMDAAELKRKYGARIVFWGGGVDTQKVLPFGTPAEVRAQVLERCRIFATGGGFVFNAIHNVQARTPVANVVAMFAAVQEFNHG